MPDTFTQQLPLDVAVSGIGPARCLFELLIILKGLAAHQGVNSVCPFCALVMWILVGLDGI